MTKKYILILISVYKKTENFRKELAMHLHLAPTDCIFKPTCSEYTYQAVEKYGVIQGLWLGFKRVLRCRPGNRGGYDPV
jgi:hypothetical protein